MLAGGAEAGGTYISPKCDRRCGKVKGRALRIHRASSEGSLAQELCSLTHIRGSPSAVPSLPHGGCLSCCSRCCQRGRGRAAELCLPGPAGQGGQMPANSLAAPPLSVPAQHPGPAGVRALASGGGKLVGTVLPARTCESSLLV